MPVIAYADDLAIRATSTRSLKEAFLGIRKERSTRGLGLDQIPTRLPTKVKSRSATPNKDRSSSRADTENF